MKRALLLSSVLALCLPASALAQDKADRFTDTHEYVDAEVHTANGERFGTIERVRFAGEDQSTVDAFVVETGGVLEIGGREILVSKDHANWSGSGDDRVLTLDFTGSEAASLPTFDEDRVSDYWLSDSDWADESDTPDEAEADGDRHASLHSDEDRQADASQWAGRNDTEWTMRNEASDTAGQDDGRDWNRDFVAADWDIEDWTDSTVYLSRGDTVGIVTDVRADEDGVRALIIETEVGYDALDNEIEVRIEDILAVRENGAGRNEIQIASSQGN